MTRKTPEWFRLSESATKEVMSRIADAASVNKISMQVKLSPRLAHWFMLDSLSLANKANREGMHANALSLTRQCLEALAVIELGICGHKDAEAVLLKWDSDNLTPGKLRAWLEQNVWPAYGTGMWNEPWTTFMGEFAAALQPYAHYGSKLSQWQVRLLPGIGPEEGSFEPLTALIEARPRAYDAQKATRITLFHAILTYTLGRIWLASNQGDHVFASQVTKLGTALGKSQYLDGHATNWSQQFWAMLWSIDGGTVLE
jgi:hypothetical protein